MKRWVILSELPAGDHPETGLAKLAALASGVRLCSAGAELPGSTGGLGAVWDVTAETDPAQLISELPGAVEVVPLRPVATHIEPLEQLRRVKRTLLLTVRAGTATDAVAEFEQDLMGMPYHIGSIKSWALSRVGGDSRWTHVWEQEFTDPDGLNGEYLAHPYHWTSVDRWFDPEMPGAIVEPAIAHLYRWASGPVLGI
ncbi:Dabb family protein [Nocardia sp. NPDC058058]|uniref:Dabb family protein n=1 Tax=Nocardia sp. NPDC058058 TaxID=3346317 RepID=UPI0036D82345